MSFRWTLEQLSILGMEVMWNYLLQPQFKKIQILGRNRITSLVFSARINMRNVLDQYAHTNKLDIIEKYVQKSTQFSSELEHNDINLQWDDISDKETMEKPILISMHG